MDSQSAAIRAKELTKVFGSFTAVDHVTFDVPRGQLFGMLGPNGAGKTTIIRMLTTLLIPTSGAATVAGIDVQSAPARVREAIGVIPQALTSDLDLTGWENLDIYGQFYGVPRRTRRERARQLLDMVGLSGRANDLVATYSGGMRRRLEIARGLVHAPQVLFLDEPTIGLDPQSRRVVWDLLERLRSESGLTISLTTHYMDEAEVLCDRIAIVDGGKIIASGSPAELKAMAKGSDRVELEVSGDLEKVADRIRALPEIYDVTPEADTSLIISTDDGAHMMPKIINAVEEAGANVSSIRMERMTLEDVFISFTGRRLRDEPTRKGGLFSFTFGLPRPPRPF